ncbi:hypothetical protein AMTRI_Chr13g124840 [Amborella trichopoda]
MWIIHGTLAWHTPPEDRWGDSGEIQCRSNFLFTRGIRAVRGEVYGQLPLEHKLRFGLNGENGAPNNASSQTKNAGNLVEEDGAGGEKGLLGI